METDEAALKEVEQAVKQIAPLLKGRGPAMQGLILADLTALWLSHHIVTPHQKEEQIRLWGELLDMHVEKIWELAVMYGEGHK